MEQAKKKIAEMPAAPAPAPQSRPDTAALSVVNPGAIGGETIDGGVIDGGTIELR